ncbi:MAG: D-alanyl-D-alanine carboxypeptidase [Saprospiraceae bacterium]|nr:D-alanyl-D-alanine carboxypeptidase [Saprospiraceae bacterium]
MKALGGKDITENVQIMLDNLQSMGLDTYPFNMEDGSGLSPRNLISPDLMASFLAKQSQYLGDVDFKNILPTVGESGTVKNMLGNSPAKGRMWIKSGSMGKILCYAGYARAASGRLITFAVFLNNSQAKTFKENKTELEKIIDTIYRFS